MISQKVPSVSTYIPAPLQYANQSIDMVGDIASARAKGEKILAELEKA